MSFCFVFDCNHRYGREKCSFFRFPQNKLRNWERLCRRQDRPCSIDNDRICSCHFVDGKKENGPTIFSWNKTKIFNFPDPEPTALRKSSTSVRPKELGGKKDDLAFKDLPLATIVEEHSYVHVCPSSSCTGHLLEERDKVLEAQEKVKALEEQLAEAKLKAEKPRPFSIEDIKDDPSKMLLYTSFSFDIFEIITKCLKRFDIQYFSGWKVQTISIDDQLLMTLMKLRLNLRNEDLATRFCTSRATVANIVKTFIVALHEFMFTGCIQHHIPSQKKCKGSMPKSFDEFGSARLVMDATEITQDIPQRLDEQATTYSNYKSQHTVKAVTCVAPKGAIVFASDLYPGSKSDVAIVEQCGILDCLKPGDLILADKGFTIHRLLPSGVNINIPPFLQNKAKFTREESQLCTKIARARIHVERANERIKNYAILDHVPSSLRPYSTQVFQLCCAFVDLQSPLLSEIADAYTCQ